MEWPISWNDVKEKLEDLESNGGASGNGSSSGPIWIEITDYGDPPSDFDPTTKTSITCSAELAKKLVDAVQSNDFAGFTLDMSDPSGASGGFRFPVVYKLVGEQMGNFMGNIVCIGMDVVSFKGFAPWEFTVAYYPLAEAYGIEFQMITDTAEAEA